MQSRNVPRLSLHGHPSYTSGIVIVYLPFSQVVQGMLLTRPGFEERVKGSSNMQEMLKWLPSDLFRTSLARVSTHAERRLLTARHPEALRKCRCRDAVVVAICSTYQGLRPHVCLVVAYRLLDVLNVLLSYSRC